MQARSHPLSVLLVEDSDIMANLLTRLVAEQPCLRFCGRVTTPSEAVTGIERLKPDVTVLDLMLDGGSGFDVLTALGGRPGPRPNVMVLTNLAGKPYRERALQLGATHFFDKSSEIPVLLAVLIGLAEERGQGNRRHHPGYERLIP